MCGRFTQKFTWSELVKAYRLTQQPLNLEPRYNIAPTTQVLTVRRTVTERIATPMRWGLIPSWWKEGNRLPSTFNARSDRIDNAPMYRSAFKARRCIVPMSGFFEWKTEGESKRPHYVTMASGEPMSVAGLWEQRVVGGEETLSCTIVTTDANATMESIHNRMPLILGEQDLDAWLSGRAGKEILRPCPAPWIEAVEVSSYVSNIRNQGDKCIEPLL